MRTALMAARPFVEEEGFRAYEAKGVPGVDLDKLVYFAASMFGVGLSTAGAWAKAGRHD